MTRSGRRAHGAGARPGRSSAPALTGSAGLIASAGLLGGASPARPSRRIPVFCGLSLALGGAACEDQRVVIGAFVPERPRFAAPEKVAALNDDGARDEDPTLTGDLLEIHFMSERGGSQDIWVSRRADLGSPWETPTVEHLEKLNSADNEDTPAISNDGLRLWFFRGGEQQAGIWMSERASRGDPWRDPFFVEALNPGHEDGTQAMNAHVDLPELRAVVGLNGPGTQGWDLAIASRESPEEAWGEFGPLAELNDAGDQLAPFLFDDGRQLFFRSGDDLFWARRQGPNDAFEAPEALEELNSPDARENDPYLSPDGSVVFFSSERSGGTDIYEARRIAP